MKTLLSFLIAVTLSSQALAFTVSTTSESYGWNSYYLCTSQDAMKEYVYEALAKEARKQCPHAKAKIVEQFDVENTCDSLTGNAHVTYKASAEASCESPVATKEYGLHLFFNETEFVDVLRIYTYADGSVAGDMIVPNDFEGPIGDLEIKNNNIQFTLFVPKNEYRPEDLVFFYKGQFFDETHQQMSGFASLEPQHDFIASFVAFLR